ncbi:hypothetical protein N7535_009206 [Penicillium sp. DV-2018c]|nr:hypothetical protein N7461_002892 [Penicillium sp. DV-2018c]KAJ5561009.1 hypothetical protein N7535_009206 [Penicillium sp. DV-2018c]
MTRPEYKSLGKNCPPRHQHMKKSIEGPLRTLRLPQLCRLGGYIFGADSLLCDIAGEVIIATLRSNPSRLQAVREYPKTDAERLIQRFGCLDHTNILSSRDCYIDANSIYVFVDDFPLTLRNVVSSPDIYPTELELAAIMSQILDGLCYLSSFGLTHQTLSCGGILLDTNGRVKIACLDQCSECSPTETYTIYANTIPRITMALMQKHEKDVGIAGVNDLNQWPVDSDAFGFLSAASTEPIESLRKHPLVAARNQPTEDLVTLARAVLCAWVSRSRRDVAPQVSTKFGQGS